MVKKENKWSKEKYNEVRKEYNKEKANEKKKKIINMLELNEYEELHKLIYTSSGFNCKYLKIIFDKEEDVINFISKYKIIKK
jgi:SepF-like predicted cell division protein (DUF552 family)